ncbi:hypothetical protein, partial [Xenorhabdus koppenhoeferi]|uniref:hypothetical protein n=1 Tax=Xenorhabdus koppenhoeferi TaxID=351659 RepID=UPI002B40A703
RYSPASAHTDCLINLLKSGATGKVSSGLRGCVSYAVCLRSQAFIFAFFRLPAAACLSAASVSGGAL